MKFQIKWLLLAAIFNLFVTTAAQEDANFCFDSLISCASDFTDDEFQKCTECLLNVPPNEFCFADTIYNCPIWADCEYCKPCVNEALDSMECYWDFTYDCVIDCSDSMTSSGTQQVDDDDKAIEACFHSFTQCTDKSLTPQEIRVCTNCLIEVTHTDELFASCDDIQDRQCTRYAECDCGICIDEALEATECLAMLIYPECDIDCPQFEEDDGDTSRKLHGGVIAGIVLALVVVLGVIMADIVLCYRRRQNKHSSENNVIERSSNGSKEETPLEVISPPCRDVSFSSDEASQISGLSNPPKYTTIRIRHIRPGGHESAIIEETDEETHGSLTNSPGRITRQVVTTSQIHPDNQESFIVKKSNGNNENCKTHSGSETDKPPEVNVDSPSSSTNHQPNESITSPCRDETFISDKSSQINPATTKSTSITTHRVKPDESLATTSQIDHYGHEKFTIGKVDDKNENQTTSNSAEIDEPTQCNADSVSLHSLTKCQTNESQGPPCHNATSRPDEASQPGSFCNPADVCKSTAITPSPVEPEEPEIIIIGERIRETDAIPTNFPGQTNCPVVTGTTSRIDPDGHKSFTTEEK